MSDWDWKAGDEAQCLLQEPWRDCNNILAPGPSFMSIHIVTKVISVVWHNETFICLAFDEFPFPLCYEASLFRKPEPLELDEEDKEIIDLMKGKEVERV